MQLAPTVAIYGGPRGIFTATQARSNGNINGPHDGFAPVQQTSGTAKEWKAIHEVVCAVHRVQDPQKVASLYVNLRSLLSENPVVRKLTRNGRAKELFYR